jgi:ATP-binding cassette subfamily B protein
MENLAYESKNKSLSLAVHTLWSIDDRANRISNLVVIYFGGIMYIDGTIKALVLYAEFILYVNNLGL